VPVSHRLWAGVVRLWEQGAEGRDSSRRRETILANQVGLLAAAATALYEVFYVLYDFSLFWPVFTANLLFIAGYLCVPLLNRAGRFTLAGHTVFGNVLVQLSVVSYLISAGAGVHLFYFTLAGLLALIYVRIRAAATLIMALVAGGLYALCHFLFVPARAVIAVPPHVLDLLYTGSVMGTVLLSAVFSFLFRQEIQRAEDELALTNRELEELSGRDALTGLANRRRLDQFLERECGRMHRIGGPLSLLMVDVDHFKRYNDRYGHQAGDLCLQAVARVVAQAARRPTDLAARYGGEEFVIVLSDTALDGAIERAEALRKAVAEMGTADDSSNTSHPVTVSVGIGAAERGVVIHPERLVKEADRALYFAKRSGRNRTAVAGDGHEPDRILRS